MVFIKIKPGTEIEGKGVYIGSANGVKYYFWKSYGKMDVPFEIAMKLQNERPQRFEIIDKNIAIKIPIINQEKDVVLPLAEIDSISGFGPETIKDVKALFHLVKNVHTVRDLIKVFKDGEHIPLQNTVAKKLKDFLLKRFPKI